jgi:hypothetical protein
MSPAMLLQNYRDAQGEYCADKYAMAASNYSSRFLSSNIEFSLSTRQRKRDRLNSSSSVCLEIVIKSEPLLNVLDGW